MLKTTIFLFILLMTNCLFAQECASGMYFYQFKTINHIETKKLVMIK